MNLLTLLERASIFSPADVELARTLGRVGHESDQHVLLAAALTSREVQAGNVCLDLNRFADTELGSPREPTLGLKLPDLDTWRAALERSSLVSTQGLTAEPRPLVLDARGRLYLARYYEHESALARRLRQLAGDAPETPAELADDPVARLFPADAGPQSQGQEQAVRAARTRRLSMIVGGPGTGKTSTVVKLLGALVADALRADKPCPRILLAAPTGKAAQRLGEAIERARQNLPLDPAVTSAIPNAASTIHRMLGSIDGSSTRFRHRRDLPLPCDILVLDEASMVDLALMRRLLDAVPAHARVIMLGDPDQLVSVEAGGVLGDLCESAADPTSPLHRCLSRLSHSFRYAQESGIGRLAAAVHAQDFAGVQDVLRSGLEDVSYGPAFTSAALTNSLEAEAKVHYRGLREPELPQKLAALDTFRVLCAHRRGHGGVEELNLALARLSSGRTRRAGDNYAGRPIMITHNDYASQLFNGDVGVMHAEGRGGLAAYFRQDPAAERKLSLARLPRHESVYAMTVHKSQGSEFDRVAIVLPERVSPILSRELLYTAITRARKALSVHASDASLRAAVTQRTQRASGLVDHLRE